MRYQMLDILLKCGKEFGHRRIRSCGISDTECLICSYVYSQNGCPQEYVVQELMLDKTTAAKALRRLEQKGWLERVQDEYDRRRKVLNLTDAGRERIAEVADLHDRWLNRVLSVLKPEEQQQFEAYFTRLLEKAENLLVEQAAERERES